MQIKKLILSPAASQYLGFAEAAMRKLDKERLTSGVSLIKKSFKINDVFFICYCSDAINKLIMWGGGGGPEILFLSPEGVLTAYSYTTNTLTSVFNITEEEFDLLHPTFNGTSHVGEKTAATFITSWKPSALDESKTHLTNDQPHELEFLFDGDTVFIRFENTILPFVNRSMIVGKWMDDYCQAQGNGPLIQMPLLRDDLLGGTENPGMWNFLWGTEFWFLSPVTQQLFQSSWWVPNFMYAENGNGALVPGFYYGKFLGSKREVGGGVSERGRPASTGKVTFNGFLDNRKRAAVLPYGYAETLVSLNDTVFNEIFFYLSSAPQSDYGNPTLLYQNPTYQRDCGTVMHGKEWTFSVVPPFTPQVDDADLDKDGEPDLDENGEPKFLDYAISFWSVEDDRVEYDIDFPTILNDYVGVVVSAGQEAIAYLWTGARYTLYRTSSYHSHSYSTNGQILAIFEQINGAINKVIVFDLNKKINGVLSPTNPIRVSEIVAPLGATTACVIPYREEKSVPPSLYRDISSLVETTFIDDLEGLKHVAHFGTVQYNNLEPRSYSYYKILCFDGIHAEAKRILDDCMRGSFTIATLGLPPGQSPQGIFYLTIEDETYEGTWDAICDLAPYAWWVSRDWPYEIIFAKWIYDNDTGYRPNHIPIVMTGSYRNPGIFMIEPPFGLKGVTSESFPPPVLEPLCLAYEQEYVKVSSKDGCGRSDSEIGIVTSAAAAPVSISGTATPSINSQYIGSGGLGTNVFSISNGGINASTGRITAVGCGSGTVTVTNDCGSASMDIRWATGSWCLNSTGSYGPPKVRVGGVCEEACHMPGAAVHYGFEVITGIQKDVWDYICCIPATGGCASGLGFADGDCAITGDPSFYPYLSQEWHYTWKCTC